MARSILTRFADWLRRRPEWPERDGVRIVLVRGFSPLDNLVFGLLQATIIVAPAIFFLVNLP